MDGDISKSISNCTPGSVYVIAYISIRRVSYNLYFRPLIARPSILVGLAPAFLSLLPPTADTLALEKNLVKLVARPMCGRTAVPMAGVVAALLEPPTPRCLAEEANGDALMVDMELFVRWCPGRMADAPDREAPESGLLGNMYDWPSMSVAAARISGEESCMMGERHVGRSKTTCDRRGLLLAL